jgi:hypothetical protein
MWLSKHATIASLCMCMLLWASLLGATLELKRSTNSFFPLADIRKILAMQPTTDKKLVMLLEID